MTGFEISKMTGRHLRHFEPPPPTNPMELMEVRTDGANEGRAERPRGPALNSRDEPERFDRPEGKCGTSNRRVILGGECALEFLKVLASKTGAGIIKILREKGSADLREMAEELGVKPQAMSRYIDVLEKYGVVETLYYSDTGDLGVKRKVTLAADRVVIYFTPYNVHKFVEEG